MDRIELDEEMEAEQYATKAIKPLDLGLIAPLSRFQVKPASNLDHAKRTALAQEIRQLWAIPIPRVMKLITRYGYQFIQETFHQIQKNPNARNPAALFLWTIKQCKVELRDL